MTFFSDNSGSLSPSPPAETPVAGVESAPAPLGGIDLDELAERVYQRWLDELRRERERSGTRW